MLSTPKSCNTPVSTDIFLLPPLTVFVRSGMFARNKANGCGWTAPRILDLENGFDIRVEADFVGRIGL